MTPYRLACVTGATSGIGKELCSQLAEKRVNLVITGRNEEALLLMDKDLSKTVSVQVFPADLVTPEGRKRVVSSIEENVPDIVINNAGFGLYGDALSYPLSDQIAILEVNAKAVMEITLAAARAMIQAGKKGVILNVSSAAAFQVSPSMAVYAASKAFVNQFSQAFDYEVKPQGVRILTMCPGMTQTNFQQRAGGLAGIESQGMMSASYVAGEILKQIEKLHPFRIVDWRYRIGATLSLFLPKCLTAVPVKRIIEARINKTSQK